MQGFGTHYIPRYAREAQVGIQKYDRFLRLRWSIDEPGLYLLERKTQRMWWPEMELGTDKATQYNDSVRMVTLLEPWDLGYVVTYLRLNDIQAHGGAKEVARAIEADEDRVADLLARHQVAELEAMSGEAYDQLAWLEERRIAMGGFGLDTE